MTRSCGLREHGTNRFFSWRMKLLFFIRAEIASQRHSKRLCRTSASVGLRSRPIGILDDGFTGELCEFQIEFRANSLDDSRADSLSFPFCL